MTAGQANSGTRPLCRHQLFQTRTAVNSLLTLQSDPEQSIEVEWFDEMAGGTPEEEDVEDAEEIGYGREMRRMAIG